MNTSHKPGLSLAAPVVAYAGFELMQRILLPAFLTGPVGLSLAVASTLLLLLRGFDILLDLALGALSDTGSGDRKLWMAAGVTIALPATWWVATTSADASITSLSLALLLAFLGWSMMNTAQIALSLESGQGLINRGRVFAWRTFMTIGGLTGFSMIVAVAGADHAQQMKLAALALIVLTPALLAVTFWRERTPKRLNRTAMHIGALPAVLALAWRTPARARLALLFALSGAHSAVWATGFAFVIGAGLKLPELLGIALLVQGITSIIGAFLWLRALAFWGARSVLCAIFSGEVLFALISLVLPVESAIPLLAWVALRGLVSGAEIMVLRAMCGDVLDEDQARLGRSTAGGNGASFQFPFAIAAAMAGSGLLWALDYAGFDPAQHTQSDGRISLILTAGLGAAISGIAVAIAAGAKGSGTADPRPHEPADSIRA